MKNLVNRRKVNKYISSLPFWTTPLVSSVALPVHAQTSNSGIEKSMLGLWEMSRIDGGSPLFMGFLSEVTQIEFLDNGQYAYPQINFISDSKQRFWSVSDDLELTWYVTRAKTNEGIITELQDDIATKMLVTSGYTVIADVMFARIS